MTPPDEELRRNGMGYLQFLREGLLKNIARLESGGIPDNWEPETILVPPEILPLLRWRLKQIDPVLEHYQSGNPLDEAPPFLVGDWAEAIDGGTGEVEEDQT